jgi:SAM-dependent methyltransferase
VARSATRNRTAPARGWKPEWRHGTDAHYVDPRYYDSCYRDRLGDIEYYVGLSVDYAASRQRAAVRTGRRARPVTVLEYGCGNGRIALPLARAGLSVTAVDRSRIMLADFTRKLRREPGDVQRRVTLARGDMRRLELHRRFDLVLCTFNTFLHLYERRDVEAFLERVKLHLGAGGLFVFDATLPDPTELGADPQRNHRVPRFRHPTSGEVVRYAERFAYDPLRQVLTIDMEFEPLNRPRSRWVMPLAHRQFFPQEVEALLHYNGFAIERIDDLSGARANPLSESLVYLCRRLRRRSATSR